MIITKCEFCGRSKSKSGKPFSQQTLLQHVHAKHAEGWEDGDPTFERTDLIADDDMPDGAYFAMAWEIGEL